MIFELADFQLRDLSNFLVGTCHTIKHAMHVLDNIADFGDVEEQLAKVHVVCCSNCKFWYKNCVGHVCKG